MQVSNLSATKSLKPTNQQSHSKHFLNSIGRFLKKCNSFTQNTKKWDIPISQQFTHLSDIYKAKNTKDDKIGTKISDDPVELLFN